ncbi:MULTISPECIES: DEAD/DEAH box helicase [Trichocoleus]|uniref:DEAD/DEAH box helicase n=1 Tax=Trichocoleus desertorum GB2-A4 TaxID=2933944 RepID=A0ABV0JCE0_9CYAN|nr:DEAD/DEAH box helicase [Trichocoleus sp. FACHB-46]MBD1864109.1 DEAD/DEAH box helicase [Trichocoleus sp. FACHB-46]
MHILHGTWIPEETASFVQSGGFHLWIETTDTLRRRKTAPRLHLNHLPQEKLATFLTESLGIKPAAYQTLETAIAPKYFLLPTVGDQPCPSPELARYLELEPPEQWQWQYWQVDCYRPTAYVKTGNYNRASVTNVIRLLNELHFIALHNLAEIQLGADLLFWYHYTQFFKQIILHDQYIPALKYRSLTPTEPPTKGKRKTASQTTTKTTKTAKNKSKATTKTTPKEFEIYQGWEILSARYEAELERYVELMPFVCVAGRAEPQEPPQFYDKMTLLRHFSEVLLAEIVTHTPTSAAFEKQINDTLLGSCLHSGHPWQHPEGLTPYQQWKTWRDRIGRSQTDLPFYLCFQLQSPAKPEDAWILEFQVASRQDPSVQIPLQDYWRLRTKRHKALIQQFGENFEQHLLIHLGYAARIYPQLWAGLETDQPVGISLAIAEASAFLQESAWVLEAAGYKVRVPAWWTPQGWRRTKLRMKARGRTLGGDDKSKSYFSFETLVDYRYELSIDGKPVSEQEWQELVNAKASLVQFRGQWMQLDQDKMQQMLEFWKKHQHEQPELSLLDFMKLSGGSEDGIELEVDHDETLGEMLSKLNEKSHLELLPDPKALQGTLRTYQKRGLAWLHYLETLGLNGCLADDMGMGKSLQVIARLVQEREQGSKKSKKLVPIPPTLLIAPTSVVGNWQKEIEKFAPHLRSLIHHGSDRLQKKEEFQAAIADCDVVITSYTLVRKDIALLSEVEWRRIVIDEAQNIKNPKAAQTKAIYKLPGQYRLALTGTPVENRLLDLWSIFNFLNPGYLGKESQFRQSFEIPIQKNNDVMRSATLKKLVEPFILRRVKTDPSIIQDLPDKLEQKLYCNLTKEQASLYEATVKDVEKQLQAAEGIQRKGLILATLMKLKQICNHPMQFLQDGSDFTPERSHKLERLTEMTQEAIAEGESLLIFTQFAEIGEALEKYLKHTLRCNTFYLHGGTPRPKREQMIAEFQDPNTEPSVFVLSLKAGGVGITLTKANHVFHFDRWWNPAVEDQATDRAFRIGQKKNVFVHKFVAIGTLEERIDQMIEDKKKLVGAIVGADESWLTELDNEAFKQLISLNRSAVLD